MTCRRDEAISAEVRWAAVAWSTNATSRDALAAVVSIVGAVIDVEASEVDLKRPQKRARSPTVAVNRVDRAPTRRIARLVRAITTPSRSPASVHAPGIALTRDTEAPLEGELDSFLFSS